MEYLEVHGKKFLSAFSFTCFLPPFVVVVIPMIIGIAPRWSALALLA